MELSDKIELPLIFFMILLFLFGFVLGLSMI